EEVVPDRAQLPGAGALPRLADPAVLLHPLRGLPELAAHHLRERAGPVLRGRELRGHLGRAVLHLYLLRAAAPALPGVGGEPAAGHDLRLVPVGARLPGVGSVPDRTVRAAAGLDLHQDRVADLCADRAPALRRGGVRLDRACAQPDLDPDLPGVMLAAQ